MEIIKILITIILGLFLVSLIMVIPFMFSLFRALQKDLRDERERMRKQNPF